MKEQQNFDKIELRFFRSSLLIFFVWPIKERNRSVRDLLRVVAAPGSSRVSVQGVESLWGDCRFIPADWGSQ